jgi:surface antigen
VSPQDTLFSLPTGVSVCLSVVNSEMRFLSALSFTLALDSILGDTHLRGLEEEGDLLTEPEMEKSIFGSVNVDQSLFVYPELFGDYNLTSCSSAPSCGTTMATYNGVAAKSNGANQCTGNSCGGYGTYGYHYQCVELAQRYFGTLYGTTPIWYGNAIDLCHTYPSGVVKTSSPIPGDLVVFNTGTYGHVAVITSVSSSTVNVIEQNSSPNGKNSYSRGSNVACYLHANKNNGGSSCHNAGWYCGDDGLGKDANTKYYCSSSGGSITDSTKCGMTCVTMPSGQNDKCTSNGSCKGLHGDYCGGDKVNGDTTTLYHCRDGAPKGATYCSNGCKTASSGYDDYCK